MANQRRSLSWLSLSSVRRPTTTTTATATKPVTSTAPPPGRSDSIRPPAFKPFRLPAPARPQKPTSPPTATATATATTIATAQRAQPPPAPTQVQPPVPQLFRTTTTKPVTSPSAPPPPQPPIRPKFRAPVSKPVSNANKAPTTTTPAPPKPQPLAITTELSSPAHTPKPSTILPHSTPSSVPISPEIKSPPAERKGVPVTPNYANPSHVDTKHHKIQSTAPGLAIQDNAVAMQRKYLEPKKYGTRVVRLVGDNIGAFMMLNSSRKKHEYGAKPLTIIQEKTLQSSKETSTSTLFLNSNVQGVNNSIAFDSCLTHNDPGLHVRTLE